MNGNKFRIVLVFFLINICISSNVASISNTEYYQFIQQNWLVQDPPWYFNNPIGITLDINKNIYIADTLNDQIQKYSIDGAFIQKWKFDRPTGIAVDLEGYVYVTSDQYKARVQKYDSYGQECAWEYDDISITYNPLNNRPFGIAISKKGNIYISDTNGLIRVFEPNGKLKSEWNNNEGLIRSDYIAVYNENNKDIIYISDSFNDCIRMYNEEGKFINKINITKPSGIAVDRNKNLYVASYAINDSSIYQYDKNGQFISKWGNTGNSYDNGQLKTPKGIVIHENYPSKSIFVVDSENNRIQKFTVDGKFLERWGTGNDKGELNKPRGINLDTHGNVFVADSLNKRIQIFKQDGTFNYMWDMYNNYSPSRVVVNSDNNTIYVTIEKQDTIIKYDQNGKIVGSIKNSEIKSPNGIVINKDNYIYVANSGNNNILIFDSNDNLIKSLSCGNSLELYGPHGIAIDNNNDIFIADTYNNRIVIMFKNEECSVVFKDHQFNRPRDIEIDHKGNFYIVDTLNNCIKIFRQDETYITSIGTEGNMAGNLKQPTDCVVSDDGQYIYVSDHANHRVLKFEKVLSQEMDKAIILAGGGLFKGNKLWNATQLCAYLAYRALTYRGFVKNQSLKILSSDTKIDLDDNNLADDIELATLENFKEALKWGKNAKNLIIYLVDHGGHHQFLINEKNEKLLADTFNSLLNELNVSENIIIIYDACKAESFISEIKKTGDQRIIITSAEQEAYFICQGVISFSYFFWKNIINGHDIKTSFKKAQKSIFNVSNGFQIAKMEPQDVEIKIGKAKSHGNPPTIDEIQYQSSILQVRVSDIDGDEINNAKVIIIPPDFKLEQADAPLIDLPTIDLNLEEKGLFEMKYNDPFKIGKDHHLIIQIDDRFGNTTISEIFIRGVKPVKRKAIIYSSDPNDTTIESKMNWAYDALSFQGYLDDEFSIFTSKQHLHLPVTNPTKDNLHETLLVCNEPDIHEVVLYLTGKSNSVNFTLNESEILMPDELNFWLDLLQEKMKGNVFILFDCNYSENFVETLSGSKRIIITTTSSNYPLCKTLDYNDFDNDSSFLLSKLCLIEDQNISSFCRNSCSLFSVLFWKEVWCGVNIRDAFRYPKENMGIISEDLMDMFVLEDNSIEDESLYVLNAVNQKIGIGIEVNIATFPGVLTGIITDVSNHRPISNAYISTNTKASTYSYENGYFHLKIEPANNIELSILANGYESSITKLSIKEGEDKSISVSLNPSSSPIKYDLKSNSNISLFRPDDDVKAANCFISSLYY